MARSVSSGRTRHDEDEDERRSISRSRSRRRDEDEEPRGRGPRDGDDSSYDEDEDRPSRSRRDREDRSNRRPRGAERSGGFQRPSNMGRGRASVRKHREARYSGPPQFKVPAKERILFKFVNDDYLDTYYEHWIRDFQGQHRQMSFVCLGDDCPLCEIGDTPGFRALINVIDLSDPADPQVKIWVATPNPMDAIDDLMDEADDDGFKINDADVYCVASKKAQRNNFTTYKVTFVDSRDLPSKWDTEPLSDSELEDLAKGAFDAEACIRINSRSELQEIADELSDED